MANPTTNYGFVMPTNTDLVKDLPADFDVFGQAVDTTIKNLNPSTTLGDIEYRSSTANTNTRLAIGTTGQVLTVSGGVPAWATISAGGMTSLASGSIAASATGFDITSISNSYNELWLYITNFSMTTAAHLQCRLNNNSSGDYSNIYNDWNSVFSNWSGQTLIPMVNNVNATQSGQSAWIRFPNYKNTTGYKHYEWAASREDNAMWFGYGFTRSTSAIDRITVICSTGSFDSGTYELFGVK